MKKVMMLFIYAGLFLLVMSLAVYMAARNGLKELNEQAREEIGGLYLDTEYGTLSYTREGSVNSSAVILVHGFSTPKFVWDQITPSLVGKGYQVITFDHLGRGFSDRPA